MEKTTLSPWAAVAGLPALRKWKTTVVGAEPRLRQEFLKGAGLLSLLWAFVRPLGQGEKDS